jgi:esterase/lipase superfamily enzyme
MKKEKKSWRSPSLGKNMELMAYGESGTPIIGLPTRGATCTQWEEFGMVDSIAYQLENGFNRLYCLSSVDNESYLNQNATPSQKLVRQQQFESYVADEVVPHVREESDIDYIIIAGIDLGGYHAVTAALKHPEVFDRAIGISGIYDIKGFLGDFYNDSVYYNNPMDFVPNITSPSLLKEIREVDFRLVSFDKDERRDFSQRMSNVFRMKFIEHDLDIWNMETHEEWDLWPQMLKTHII